MIKELGFLAGATPRSLDYLRALVESNLTPDVLFLMDDGLFLPGQRDKDKEGAMGRTLESTAKDAGMNVKRLPADVNSNEVVNAISDYPGRTVIYSGYGGALLRVSILDTGKEFLHIHSGLLPDYKGSTNIYYALLNRDDCGASALLIDKGIDTGRVVGRLKCDTPRPGEDIDYEYDITMRTKLLVDMVKQISVHGRLPAGEMQKKEEGRVYYIIHPVLKHIAIMRKDG
jgi:methionyl-tRNA formyltransferase